MIWLSLAGAGTAVVPWEDGLLFDSGGRTLRCNLGCKSDQLFFLANMLRDGGLLSDILFFAANHRPGARKIIRALRMAIRGGFLAAERSLPSIASGRQPLAGLLAARHEQGDAPGDILYYDSEQQAWQGLGWVQHKAVGRRHVMAILRCGADLLLISIPRHASFCLECAFRWLVGNSVAFTESLARLRHFGAGRAHTGAQARFFEGSGNQAFLARFVQQLDKPAMALLFNNGKPAQPYHDLTEHPSCSRAGRHAATQQHHPADAAPAGASDLAAHLTSKFVGPCHPAHSFSMTSAAVGDATYYLARATVNSAYRSGVTRPLTCFGDGDNPAIATIRCVAEAIERFALMHYSKSGWVTATAAQLGNRVADAARQSWYSAEQYRSAGFAYAPAAAHEMREWVPCVALHTNEDAFIWPELIYPTYQPLGRKPVVATSSTGAAVHSTLTDALVNAALEVIERDALALYFFTGMRPVEIAPDSLASTQVQQIGHLTDAGYAVLVLLLECDVKVPTVLILATRAGKSPFFLKGASAGLTVAEACERAMREVWRSHVLYNHMGASPPLPGQVAPTSTEYNLAAYQVADVLDKLGALGTPLRRARLAEVDRAQWHWDGIVAHLHGLGMQAVYVDLATDAIRRQGLFAVKVIISGLVPVSFALQPTCLGLDRIYALPLLLGQRERRLTPAEINQSVHFFS